MYNRAQNELTFTGSCLAKKKNVKKVGFVQFNPLILAYVDYSSTSDLFGRNEITSLNTSDDFSELIGS